MQPTHSVKQFYDQAIELSAVQAPDHFAENPLFAALDMPGLLICFGLLKFMPVFCARLGKRCFFLGTHLQKPAAALSGRMLYCNVKNDVSERQCGFVRLRAACCNLKQTREFTRGVSSNNLYMANKLRKLSGAVPSAKSDIHWFNQMLPDVPPLCRNLELLL